MESLHHQVLSRRRPGDFLLRSLLPLAALLLLLSTLWVGSWGFLIGCIAWWNIVRRIL